MNEHFDCVSHDFYANIPKTLQDRLLACETELELIDEGLKKVGFELWLEMNVDIKEKERPWKGAWPIKTAKLNAALRGVSSAFCGTKDPIFPTEKI